MAGLTKQTSERDRIFGTKAGPKSAKSERIGSSAGSSPLCPQCGSEKVWRDALRYSMFGDRIQRWLCRDCGRRFSDPADVQKAWSMFERVERVDTKPKKATDDTVSTRQICVTETKNLAAEQQTTEVLRRNETDAKGKIVEYSFWLLKEGYAKSTIQGRTKLMKRMAKLGADIFNPESRKEVIGKQEWNPSRKCNAVDAYTTFLRMLNLKWQPPIYFRVRKLPFIPTENEIDQLIGGCNKRMATFLQLLKETGMRCGEACQLLKWIDIDFEQKSVRVTPEKGSNPRILPISIKLVNMLNNLPKNMPTVFIPNADNMRKSYQRQRKHIAAKLQNQRILNISFHTFRHYKGTMEYARTKDILHVMQVLGHKNIKNTLIYTQLIDFKDEEFVAKVAHSEAEVCQLIEGGFEYVCDFEPHKIFRKRK